MISFIDLKAQQETIRALLEERIRKVLDHGQYIMGPEIKELEEGLADFTCAKHAISCSSGTDALLMVLMAWGVGPGDAVFTTPFTFIATAEVISLLGATPVFVDIDPQTFNMDPAGLKLAIRAVRENKPEIYPLPWNSAAIAVPKAVIPVDLFGLPADYDPILDIAGRENLPVLEDAAQGFGGVYKGRNSGALGNAGAVSFFPAKPLGCYGDGGAIFTNDEQLARKLYSIRTHGQGAEKYENVCIGLNARLDTLQAAILLPKLKIFPRELAARQMVAERYTALLQPATPYISPPFIPAGLQSAWAQYSILCEDRDALQATLKEAGIPSMIYYPKPLHRQKAYAGLGYRESDFPVSEKTCHNILSLPMHPYLQDDQIEMITGVITKFAANKDKRTYP
jgi:UDP-2-acetamido-2-deoxy-ribo-hexuluronate aminotransferase